MVDRLFQVAYICAYRLMRLYWAVCRPNTHGALVAVWYKGTILLIRNSYVRYYSLPGGYVRRGETGRQTAIRELLEEVGVSVRDDLLIPVLDGVHDWEHKHEHLEIFQVELADRPDVVVDNREVIEAAFFPPQEALELLLFPPLRQHIEEWLSENA